MLNLRSIYIKKTNTHKYIHIHLFLFYRNACLSMGNFWMVWNNHWLLNILILLFYFLLKVNYFIEFFLFSVKLHHESAIGIHIYAPFWTSLPFPSPSHPSRLIESPCLDFLSHAANSRWLSILLVPNRKRLYIVTLFI